MNLILQLVLYGQTLISVLTGAPLILNGAPLDFNRGQVSTHVDLTGGMGPMITSYHMKIKCLYNTVKWQTEGWLNSNIRKLRNLAS